MERGSEINVVLAPFNFPSSPESPVFSCLVACAANDDDYKKLVIDSGK